MALRLLSLVLVLIVASRSEADEFEDILLYKFAVQKQADLERLRAHVTDAVAKAKELKDTDPDAGIELLRAAVNRIYEIKLISSAERRALVEIVQPLVVELRDVSLQSRREKASKRIDAFKDYLEVSAYEGRYPGRSGLAQWEPAVFYSPDGQSRPGKLLGLSTGSVTLKYGMKEQTSAPMPLPLIQVFGGFYVFDKSVGHHVFLTNREFYDSVWSLLVRKYETEDIPGRKLTPTELARAKDAKRLGTSIESGEFFLRSLADQEPIPGVGDDAGPFLEYLTQTIMHKGLPLPLDRIYSREMQDRLVGLSKMHLSATRRSLFLLLAKDVGVSPIYAEIVRDETGRLLRSEYAGFSESEANRAVVYLFSKLK